MHPFQNQNSKNSEKGPNTRSSTRGSKFSDNAVNEAFPKSSPWTFFIKRRPIAWLAIIAILLLGSFSGYTLPREINPEVNIPYVSITTALPGSNPGDTESLITKKIEREIASINDIKTISSTSGLGISSILIELEANADIDKRILDIKDKIDLVKSDLPEDATDPMILKADPNAESIVNFSIIGDKPLYELTSVAETIQDELEKITDVSKVNLVGGQKKEISVILDQKKSENYGVNIRDISRLIESENNNIPIGIINIDKANYSIRIDNRFQSIDDIGDIPLMTIGSPPSPILLKDIAAIEETFPERPIISKLSINGEKSLSTVSLGIISKENANVIKIVDTAKERIEELKTAGTVIPKDVNVAVSSDMSQFIRTDLGILTRSGIQTTILIIIILFLALGLREGIIAGLIIPFSLLATLIIMDLQGFTINSLTLFSLVIALGLMVDTAIVIMEGIHENRKNGLSGVDSAILAVHTYKWPLVAGTMTTVFAFFPMLLVSGILGEFLKSLPLTISAALLSSLVISLTISPSITAKFVEKKNYEGKGSILEPFFNKIREKFYNFIGKILAKKSKRISILIISILLFIGSLALPITGALKVEMFPPTDLQFFMINIETPKGIALEETRKITEKIEKILYEIPEIDNFLTIIGSSQGQISTDLVSVDSGSESNKANITINLVEKDQRKKKSYEVATDLRKKLELESKNFSNALISVREFSEGPPGDSPVVARITGDELEVLEKIAGDIKNVIKSTPGTQNIKTSLTPGLNEFKFTLDKEKLSFHGLSGIQVSSLIRSIIQGVEATEVTFNGEDFSIIVKYDIETKNNNASVSIKDIENFEVTSPKGYNVTIGELGSYEFGESLSSINREDQKRIVKVSSDVEKNGNVVDITTKIQTKLEKYDLPSGYEIKFGGDLEQINESFRDLFRSMAIGVILIIFTLVLMFNSLRQPFIIISALPLSLIGVFSGLMLIGLPLSFPAFLGVVALAGIVVNDAIVLIDRININRRNGVEFGESITEAAHARLQPILMTSITTIVGILPLSLTNEFWSGLGFALIFGLATSTPLTLIVIPSLYYMFEGGKGQKKLLFQTKSGNSQQIGLK